ncbi:MAG: hypothetical protein IPM86_06420 [Saprospiraceae bacterium]|nr:hypothetical protein [Saprospiraceae bacterium]
MRNWTKAYYIAVFTGNVDPVTGNVNYRDRYLQNTPRLGDVVACLVAEIKGVKGNEL